MQPSYTMLCTCMAADLHSSKSTAGLHHFRQQTVDRYSIWCSVVRLYPYISYIVGYCRNQSRLFPHKPCHVVQQCGHGGLSVCPSHPQQLQLPRWIAIPLRSYIAQCYGRGADFYVSSIASLGVLWQPFTHHSSCPSSYGLTYIFMAIYSRSRHSNKHATGSHFPGIGSNACDGYVFLTKNILHNHTLK